DFRNALDRQPDVLNVPRYAHYFGIYAVADEYPLAKPNFAAPEAAHEGLVDDNNRRRALPIAPVEGASAQDRNPHALEAGGASGLDGVAGPAGQRRLGMPFRQYTRVFGGRKR